MPQTNPPGSPAAPSQACTDLLKLRDCADGMSNVPGEMKEIMARVVIDQAEKIEELKKENHYQSLDIGYCLNHIKDLERAQEKK